MFDLQSDRHLHLLSYIAPFCHRAALMCKCAVWHFSRSVCLSWPYIRVRVYLHRRSHAMRQKANKTQHTGQVNLTQNILPVIAVLNKFNDVKRMLSSYHPKYSVFLLFRSGECLCMYYASI